MSLTAIVYVSTAVRLMDDDELAQLLSDARAFNEQADVTGALLYDEGNFFQYLEGADASVEKVYERVRASKRHKGLIKLFHSPIEQRQFGSWFMGFSRAPSSVLLQLASAQWSEMVNVLQEVPGTSAGQKLLLDFWASARKYQTGSTARRY